MTSPLLILEEVFWSGSINTRQSSSGQSTNPLFKGLEGNSSATGSHEQGKRWHHCIYTPSKQGKGSALIYLR